MIAPVGALVVQGLFLGSFVAATQRADATQCSGRPLLVLAGWLVVALIGVLLVKRRRAHTLEAR